VEGEHYNYLANVLRLKAGANLTLFNGMGGEYTARLASLSRKSALIEVGEHLRIERDSSLDIVLCQGIAKGEKMDWIVRKATELGVSAIMPVLAERSQFTLKGERLDKKILHWERIIISACEQCGRNRLPVLLPARRVSECFPDTPGIGTHLPAPYDSSTHLKSLFLDPQASQGLPCAPLEKVTSDPVAWALWIGPEGGFSAQEMSAAQAAPDTLLCRMGPRVMRTETAGLAAISILQHQLGDLASSA
jgi:16S rRNA (uracil1498-N3)-methyltransferase